MRVGGGVWYVFLVGWFFNFFGVGDCFVSVVVMFIDFFVWIFLDFCWLGVILDWIRLILFGLVLEVWVVLMNGVKDDDGFCLVLV